MKVSIRDKPYTLATLCLLVRGKPVNEVLLGYKKTGFGQGKYSGFGGKVEPDETIISATIRELQEETGVSVAPEDLHYTGQLAFYFPQRPSWSQLVHVYLAWQWLGQPTERDEMVPLWFKVEHIPYERMWKDGIHWLPPILAGRFVEADFEFQPDNESIENFRIQFREQI